MKQQNQSDAKKTLVWVPRGCPESGLSNNFTSLCRTFCNATMVDENHRVHELAARTLDNDSRLQAQRAGICSSSLRYSLNTISRISLPFCDATSCRTLSISPDMDSAGFRRADSGNERGGIRGSEHGSWVVVDDSKQSANRRFYSPPPSLPVLDSIKAEPKRVREFWLGSCPVGCGSLSRQLPGAHVP